MNETTKAILRRELERRDRDVAQLISLRDSHLASARDHEDSIARSQAISDDIRSTLVASAERVLMQVDGLAGPAPGLDLTHGETVHIHNA